MLLTRGMQVQLNRAEKEVCDAVHPRRLISITTVVGDAYYCVPLHVFLMTLSRLLDSFARQTNVTSLHAFQVFLVIAESHPLPLLRSSLKQYPALRDDPETTLARSVRKLIKTNMVQQIPDPMDTRTTQIYLTD